MLNHASTPATACDSDLHRLSTRTWLRRRATAPHTPRRLSRRIAGTASCLALAVPILGGASAPARADSSQPVFLSSGFAGSVGIDVHSSYNDTPYGDTNAVVSALKALGVHHVQDGIQLNRPDVDAQLRALAANRIRLALYMGDPYDTDGIEGLFGHLDKLRLAYDMDALSDPNEWNNSGDPDWMTDVTAYSKGVFDRRNSDADPAIRRLPIYGPSFTSFDEEVRWQDTAPHQIGRYYDYGNVHPYPGGAPPTLAAHLESNSYPDCGEHNYFAAGFTPCMGYVATETGYHNAVNAQGQGVSVQPGVPQDVQAVYTLREYLDFFQAGVTRTYNYELVNEFTDPGHTNPEAEFGLFNNDWSPKPAATALGRLMRLENADPGGTAAPVNVALTAAGGSALPDTVHTLVLAHGGYDDLVVWNDVSIYDQNAHTPIPVAPLNATLQTSGFGSAATFQPTLSATRTAFTTRVNGMAVQVRPWPTVIRLR